MFERTRIGDITVSNADVVEAFTIAPYSLPMFITQDPSKYDASEPLFRHFYTKEPR